jgi:hypothetical protein
VTRGNREAELSVSCIALDCRKVVCLEREIRKIGEPGPRQDDEIQTRAHALQYLVLTKDFAQQTFRPVSAGCSSETLRGGNSKTIDLEGVWKREQGQVAAPRPCALLLNPKELWSPTDPFAA